MNEIRQLTTTTGEWQTTKLDVQWLQRTFKAYILNEHKRKTTNEKHNQTRKIYESLTRNLNAKKIKNIHKFYKAPGISSYLFYK